MRIRSVFKLLGVTFVVGLITIGIYALGVQFNWYGQLEDKGQLVDDSYPEKLLLEKNKFNKKLIHLRNKFFLEILMSILLTPLMPSYGACQF